MTYIRPQFSRNEVRKCGKILAKKYDGDYNHALEVANNWRGAHLHPSKTFLRMLQRESLNLSHDSTSVHRIKRLPSIIDKLDRLESSDLVSMQDVGGCRTVLHNIKDLNAMEDRIKSLEIKHRFIREKDYIDTPKSSGYRGKHLIYRYYSDRNVYYNGLFVEIQLRTKRQHAWATTVEIAGDNIGEALKAGKGSADWLNFFRLASSAIASIEKSPFVNGTPENIYDLKQELEELYLDLDVKNKLENINRSYYLLNKLNVKPKNNYFLLDYQVDEHKIFISTYQEKDFSTMTEKYLEIEQKYKDTMNSVVVVSGDSFKSMRYAYGNYFGDVSEFIKIMDTFLK